QFEPAGAGGVAGAFAAGAAPAGFVAGAATAGVFAALGADTTWRFLTASGVIRRDFGSAATFVSAALSTNVRRPKRLTRCALSLRRGDHMTASLRSGSSNTKKLPRYVSPTLGAFLVSNAAQGISISAT